ncbi:MAG: carbohydrate kinase family protein [Thermoprotei archaeon]|nr:carbohydrate kinase family protein [Thermoprotei archaeon]
MSVACLGEILAEIRGNRHLTEGLNFKVSIGGLASKIATKLSSLGVNTGFFGAVGNDVFGKFLIETLNSEGVNTENIIVKDLRTSLVMVLGSDVKVFFRKPYFNSADTELTINDVNLDEILEYDALLYTLLSLTENPLKHTIHYIAKTMFKNGRKTFFHIHPILPYTLSHEEITSILKYTSYVLIDHDVLPLFGTSKAKTLTHIIFKKASSVKEVAIVYDNKVLIYYRGGYEETLATCYHGKVKCIATYLVKRLREK